MSGCAVPVEAETRKSCHYLTLLWTRGAGWGHTRASLPSGEDALGSHYSSPSETHGPQLPSPSLPCYLPHLSSILLPAYRPSVRETRAKWNARDDMRVCGHMYVHMCVPTDTPHMLGSPQLVTWCQSFPSNWPFWFRVDQERRPWDLQGMHCT